MAFIALDSLHKWPILVLTPGVAQDWILLLYPFRYEIFLLQQVFSFFKITLCGIMWYGACSVWNNNCRKRRVLMP